MSAQPQPDQSTGFSLIELLVVIAVMAVILGGGIAGFIVFNERQTLLSTSQEIKTLLRSTQTKARVREIPDGCDHLQGYRVVIPQGSGVVLEAMALCGEERATASPVETPRLRLQIPSQVTLSLTPSATLDPGELNFYTLHGGVSLPDGASSLTVGLNGFGRTYSFEITSDGEITEGEFDND